MDPYLITMIVRERVEATPAAVMKATTGAQEQKHKLLVLGTKGSRKLFFGADVAKYTADQWLKAAQQGLVYIERFSDSDLDVFAAAVDYETGAISLPELYVNAYARRSYTGKPEEPKEQQATMPL